LTPFGKKAYELGCNNGITSIEIFESFFPLSVFDNSSLCLAASASKLFSATLSEAAELTASMTGMMISSP
jgi:hypothetical protein